VESALGGGEVHFRFTFACQPARMSKFSTKLQWGNGRWIVMLYRGTDAIAAMSIEDWAALSATKHVLEYKPAKRPRPVPKWLADIRRA
jgi:hypothetical protein